MADIVYQWNPFQEVIGNDIPREVIKTSGMSARREFVPRNAPFFSRNVKIYRKGSTTPLVLGTDYVFAHPFDKFVTKYKRNAFGSVVMLKDYDDILEMDYSTIGKPFVLDQAAYLALVANIVNGPRTIDWSLLVNVPADFPTDPHTHPINQTYDYMEMMVALRSLINAMVDNQTGITMNDLLKEHLEATLIEAHKASADDIGLGLTPNMPAGEVKDLIGNSANKLVTISLLKTALRQLVSGGLSLGPDSDVPQPPSSLKITESTLNGVTVYGITVNDGAAADGKPVTYSLSQSGPVTVILSKSVGVQNAEQVTFAGPVVSTEAVITISAVTVDSIGTVSDPISAKVTLMPTAESNDDLLYFMGQF